MPCLCITEGCNNLADCGDEYCPQCLIKECQKEDEIVDRLWGDVKQ